MINDLKLIDNVEILYEETVVLYACGYRGIEALGRLREIGLSPSCFCDSDARKWETSIEGVGVISPTELKQLDNSEKLAIIITTDQVQFVDQIIDDINGLNLRTENIFTLFGLTVSLERNHIAHRLMGGHYFALQDMRRDIFCCMAGTNRLEVSAKWAKNSNAVLVYSSPKTGSVTIHKSLQDIGVCADHLHELTELTIFSDPINEGLLVKYSQEQIRILKNCKRVKVISLIREPIIKNFSLVFHVMGHYDFKLDDIPFGKSFINSFLSKIDSYKGAPMDSLNWFDNELKAALNIDVYAHPFDREKGYSIIKQGNIEVLVMKLEKLNALEPIIAEFIGTSRFKVIADNVSDAKMYKYLYRQVRETIGFPKEMFNYYYNDPRMTHFYCEEEIASFWGMWKNNIK